MSVFEFLDPAYLKAQLDRLSNLNISLTELRDAIRGAGNRTLSDLYNVLYDSGTGLTVAQLLAALRGALDSVGTDSLRTTLTGSLPAGDNWIGRVKIGDGTNVVAVLAADLAGSIYNGIPVLPDATAMFAAGPAYTEQEVAVSTSEQTSSFSPPLKMVVLCNEGDVDIVIKLNGGTTQKVLPARACKSISLWKIDSISYVVSSGSSTLRIEGYW